MERARLSAGYTIPEVAVKLARCTTTIRRYELGQTQPSRDVFLALARMYGVEPEALVDA